MITKVAIPKLHLLWNIIFHVLNLFLGLSKTIVSISNLAWTTSTTANISAWVVSIVKTLKQILLLENQVFARRESRFLEKRRFQEEYGERLKRLMIQTFVIWKWLQLHFLLPLDLSIWNLPLQEKTRLFFWRHFRYPNDLFSDSHLQTYFKETAFPQVVK